MKHFSKSKQASALFRLRSTWEWGTFLKSLLILNGDSKLYFDSFDGQRMKNFRLILSVEHDIKS